MTIAPLPAAPAALPWRLLAGIYDALPVLALWMAASAVVLVLRGNQPFAPFSVGQWLLWFGCWAIAGFYARIWWGAGGAPRYAVATVSLAAFGLGFLWSLFDRERRTWHDLASHTKLVREARR
jgi:uncharacterized RDD family membrane protein YckC